MSALDYLKSENPECYNIIINDTTLLAMFDPYTFLEMNINLTDNTTTYLEYAEQNKNIVNGNFLLIKTDRPGTEENYLTQGKNTGCKAIKPSTTGEGRSCQNYPLKSNCDEYLQYCFDENTGIPNLPNQSEYPNPACISMFILDRLTEVDSAKLTNYLKTSGMDQEGRILSPQFNFGNGGYPYIIFDNNGNLGYFMGAGTSSQWVSLATNPLFDFTTPIWNTGDNFPTCDISTSGGRSIIFKVSAQTSNIENNDSAGFSACDRDPAECILNNFQLGSLTGALGPPVSLVVPQIEFAPPATMYDTNISTGNYPFKAPNFIKSPATSQTTSTTASMAYSNMTDYSQFSAQVQYNLNQRFRVINSPNMKYMLYYNDSIKGGDNRWYLLYNPIYHNSFLQLYTTDIKVGENKQTCGAGFGQKAVPTIEFGYNNYFGGSCANNTHTSSNACKQILKNYSEALTIMTYGMPNKPTGPDYTKMGLGDNGFSSYNGPQPSYKYNEIKLSNITHLAFGDPFLNLILNERQTMWSLANLGQNTVCKNETCLTTDCIRAFLTLEPVKNGNVIEKPGGPFHEVMSGTKTYLPIVLTDSNTSKATESGGWASFWTCAGAYAWPQIFNYYTYFIQNYPDIFSDTFLNPTPVNAGQKTNPITKVGGAVTTKIDFTPPPASQERASPSYNRTISNKYWFYYVQLYHSDTPGCAATNSCKTNLKEETPNVYIPTRATDGNMWYFNGANICSFYQPITYDTINQSCKITLAAQGNVNAQDSKQECNMNASIGGTTTPLPGSPQASEPASPSSQSSVPSYPPPVLNKKSSPSQAFLDKVVYTAMGKYKITVLNIIIAVIVCCCLCCCCFFTLVAIK